MGSGLKRSREKGSGAGCTRGTRVSRNPGCMVTLSTALLELNLKVRLTRSSLAAVKLVL